MDTSLDPETAALTSTRLSLPKLCTYPAIDDGSKVRVMIPVTLVAVFLTCQTIVLVASGIVRSLVQNGK
jgi:hypothetical protein